ncbi:FCPF [Symbiodinium sp. CCMP2592]|nr:FCPF [Symbiodinium sp. CCMP2592]
MLSPAFASGHSVLTVPKSRRVGFTTRSTVSTATGPSQSGGFAWAALGMCLASGRKQVGLRGGSSTLRPAIAHVLGVQAPAAFWDPLELSADGDVALFKSRKAASVVHGRMCMVACAYELGCQHFSQSFVAWADMPGALQTCTAEFLALCELFSHKFGWHRRTQPVDREIAQLLSTTPWLRRSDFDSMVRQHLHAFHGLGGALQVRAALAEVRKSTEGRSREAVRSWPAYLYKLLKKAFVEAKSTRTDPVAGLGTASSTGA